MARIPTHRPPTHPGEVLREEFLAPLGLSQAEVARALGVPFQRLNEVVRAVTPATALRLARYFGTTAAFWMNLQLAVDLYEAERADADALAEMEPLS